ncbi:response regulator transcription factor [Haliscomenobacter hydrossis]|uniref:Two component transcriptional regulator, LuxR family n=1 Tax=Haliscomenobacter hydrossis (strain ATCC 27775 / DSM 1100 / LMG 10767 / O) TaxID=760192 RepID=F4KYE8_HALH1|nr:response regulator transcription factor [Haliscomenobacter hydrossis]AEE49389.1 two component transcriptional regulator, LuxR family [Haliscomenobacter hydrossis DSM 1100]
MIQIALVDDEALFRKGMKLLLEDYEGITVMLEAQDGEHLLQQLRQASTLPDVLLLDMKMPNLNGVDTAKVLQEAFPTLKIIVLSTYFSKAFIVNMIELGAGAYLPKNANPDEVVATIREVYSNGFSYNQAVLEVIRDNMLQKSKPKMPLSFGVDITSREKEILQLICEEYTTSEIAEKLFISPRTVDGHRNNLLEKLSCKNVAGLVVYAIQYQLVKINPETFWFKKR